ncbi:MAG: SsrA-binding protein SmpB [Myxococcota bacterium]
MSTATPEVRILTDNRRVRHEYHLEETFEAGLALLGSEVKSLRMGNANLTEAWIRIDIRGGLIVGASLVGAHIAPYTEANRMNHEPMRDRRLLLHGHELVKLHKGVRQRGMTVVPVKLYLKGSRIKVEIALARGKKLHDKRETLKARDARREMDRARR